MIPSNTIILSAADTLAHLEGDSSVMDGAIERARGLARLIKRVCAWEGFPPPRDWIDILSADGDVLARFRGL